MVRIPKSVAVSYYHHMKKLSFYQYDGTFTGFLPTFMEGLGELFIIPISLVSAGRFLYDIYKIIVYISLTSLTKRVKIVFIVILFV